MEVCGKYISMDAIEEIRGVVAGDPGISRGKLSRLVCERLGWRSCNGRLQEVSGRQVLAKLDRCGVIDLPVRDKGSFFKSPGSSKSRDLPSVPEVACSLSDLGAVQVIAVPGAKTEQSQQWNAMMDTYHYLGSGPLCGAQIRYLVRSPQQGWLGALSFSAPAWHLKPRDRWIGWSEAARRANLRKVVCNSRFLILPTVRVDNLASHVLSLALVRLLDDWHERYAYRPVLVETFVDPTRFFGACYRAANWKSLGNSAGRSTAFPNGKVSDGPKEIFVYPLSRRWRSILCREPRDPLCSRPRPETFSDWAEEEFTSIGVYDKRLKARLFGIARDFFAQPGEPIPQALEGSQAKTKGAYRFFTNKRVTMDKVLRAHTESTVERIKSHSLVFSVQDTTVLNYTSHHTEGLGPIGTKKAPSTGLIVHDTMAFSAQGTPLGLLDVQCWARDPKQAGKKYRRKELPIEEKESNKWLKSYRAAAEVQALCPDSTLVSMGDREADIYELFDEAAQTPGGPKLLIRAERSRNRRVKGAEQDATQYLWERMSHEPVAGHVMIRVPKRHGRPSRDARLEIRFACLELMAPRGKGPGSLALWSVYASEVDYGAEVSEPLEWMLLTNIATSTFEQATERLEWYAGRWNIEVYHRILKSGCRIEDRFLQMGERLETCLAIDMVVAWRIHWLTHHGRETPDLPCDVFLTEEQWKVLWVHRENKPPPGDPPPLSWCVGAIGRLGGFLGRKGDGHPGPTVIWRGLLRLHYLTIGSRTQHLIHEPRAGP